MPKYQRDSTSLQNRWEGSKGSSGEFDSRVPPLTPAGRNPAESGNASHNRQPTDFANPNARAAVGVVYFVGSADGSGLVKIGTSTDVESRLASLQAGSPVPLKVEAAFAGGRDEERALHKRFAAYREHGEWFRRAPEVSDLIAQIAACFTEEASAEVVDAVLGRIDWRDVDPHGLDILAVFQIALRLSYGEEPITFEEEYGIPASVVEGIRDGKIYADITGGPIEPFSDDLDECERLMLEARLGPGEVLDEVDAILAYPPGYPEIEKCTANGERLRKERNRERRASGYYERLAGGAL